LYIIKSSKNDAFFIILFSNGIVKYSGIIILTVIYFFYRRKLHEPWQAFTERNSVELFKKFHAVLPSSGYLLTPIPFIINNLEMFQNWGVHALSTSMIFTEQLLILACFPTLL
jgi:hypothetical protein